MALRGIRRPLSQIAEARIALSLAICVISEKAAFVDRHVGIRHRYLEMDVLEHCATNRVFIANILARLDHVADLQTPLCLWPRRMLSANSWSTRAN